MRISTLVIVVVAVAAGGYGIYKLGHAADKPANEMFTVAGIPQQASVATAESNLAGAVAAASSYKLDHSGYSGMSANDLRSNYDSTLAAGITVRTATAAAYCIESDVGSTVVSIHGPNGSFVVGSCKSSS